MEEKIPGVVLAIECSTPLCSVALSSGGKIYEHATYGQGTHSSALFTGTEEILRKAERHFSDVTDIILAEGPGSYTGLRVAASAVKGLLFGQNIRFWKVNTLAGLAMGLEESASDQTIHSIIDARRNHVYYQCFRRTGGSLKALSEVSIIEIPDIYELLSPEDVLVGTGISRLAPEKIEKLRIYDVQQTGARGLLRIFSRQAEPFISEADVVEFEPHYYH